MKHNEALQAVLWKDHEIIIRDVLNLYWLLPLLVVGSGKIHALQ